MRHYPKLIAAKFRQPNRWLFGLTLISLVGLILGSCGDVTSTPIPVVMGAISSPVTTIRALTKISPGPTATIDTSNPCMASLMRSRTPTPDTGKVRGTMIQIFPELNNLSNEASAIHLQEDSEQLHDGYILHYDIVPQGDKFIAKGKISATNGTGGQKRYNTDLVVTNTVTLEPSIVHEFLRSLTLMTITEEPYKAPYHNPTEQDNLAYQIDTPNGPFSLYMNAGTDQSCAITWGVDFAQRHFILDDAFMAVNAPLQNLLDSRLAYKVVEQADLTPTPTPTATPKLGAISSVGQVFPALANLPTIATKIHIEKAFTTISCGYWSKYTLQYNQNGLTGTGEINSLPRDVNGTPQMVYTRAISVPNTVAQGFLQALPQIPIQEGAYQPIEIIGDEQNPNIVYEVDTPAGTLTFFTNSYNPDDTHPEYNLPWGFTFDNRTFVIKDPAAYQALDKLMPYLYPELLKVYCSR